MIKTFKKHLVCLEHQNHVVYLKLRSKQKLCGREDQYTTSSFLLSLKTSRPKKQIKKIINISYLIIAPIKMKLLVFSQYGLACKYGIISPISIHNWMQNCIF